VGREARKIKQLFKGTAMQHYQQLLVWQKAMDLTVFCYAITKFFPAEERFGLTSQMRRASVSVPSNIAEGHGRFHTKEFLNHLSMARGSLAELETQFMIAQRVGYLAQDQLAKALAMTDEIGRMTTGLRQSLEAKLC
jgi:four helix bundle protein